jgi:hypothetical protein
MIRTNDDVLTDVPRYGQVSLGRFNSGSGVTAFYMQHDLISFIQDNMPRSVLMVPTAMGTRIKIRGPFDAILDDYAHQLSTALPDTTPPITADWQTWVSYLYNTYNNIDLPISLVGELLLKMGTRHTTNYYHYGLLTRRVDSDNEITWNILGNTSEY